MPPFKFSAELTGHVGDVRALALTLDGRIVSAGRDKTTRVWKLVEGKYQLDFMFRGHTEYIVCLAVLPPGNHFPNGLVVAGSSKAEIFVYTVDTPEPLLQFEAHENMVTSVRAVSHDRFLSSSCDGTVKLWSIGSASFLKQFFAGSQAFPVWDCLMMRGSLVVTACADRLIKVFSNNEEVPEFSLNGHEDCVRSLTAIDDETFFSTGNDGKVIRWNISTHQILRTLTVHSNYLYKSVYCPARDLLISTGEEGFTAVMQSGDLDPIPHPVFSVWSSIIIHNGDIATGASDGIIRIFTQDPQRRASEAAVAAFEKSVETFRNQPKQSRPTKSGERSLPGPEGLLVPGNSDGEIKIVKDGTDTLCYVWKTVDMSWHRFGELVGGANQAGEISNPDLERDYDHVFTVDVDSSRPALKLYYNRGQDPYEVANAFIVANNLPKTYLSDIVDHIVKNSGPPPETPASDFSSYVDPYTGASRYIPGGSQPLQETTSSMSGSLSSASLVPSSSEFFPVRDFILFDVSNALPKMRAKILDFSENAHCPQGELTPDVLNNLIMLCENGSTPTVEALVWIKDMLQWEEEILFPVLDMVRLLVRHPTINRGLCSGDNGQVLMEVLIKCLRGQNVNNIMLACRIISNMLVAERGKALLAHYTADIIQYFSAIGSLPMPKSAQLAVCTCLLNLGIYQTVMDNKEGVIAVNTMINYLCTTMADPDALLKLFMGIGTFLQDSNYEINSEAMAVLKKFAGNEALHPRASACAKQVMSAIENHTHEKVTAKK